MITKINDLNIINQFLGNFDVSVSSIGVFSNYLVYIDNNEYVGFLNYDLIYDRVEIEYIYVKDEYRRKGIASKLIDEMSKNIINCKNISLEVKTSNKPAISFYKKLGFKEVAIREKYYGNEDGILMVKEM